MEQRRHDRLGGGARQGRPRVGRGPAAATARNGPWHPIVDVAQTLAGPALRQVGPMMTCLGTRQAWTAPPSRRTDRANDSLGSCGARPSAAGAAEETTNERNERQIAPLANAGMDPTRGKRCRSDDDTQREPVFRLALRRKMGRCHTKRAKRPGAWDGARHSAGEHDAGHLRHADAISRPSRRSHPRSPARVSVSWNESTRGMPRAALPCRVHSLAPAPASSVCMDVPCSPKRMTP